MSNFIYILIAEARKQVKLTFHSYMIIFSLLLWPVLYFFAFYYSYQSFDFNGNDLTAYFKDRSEVMIFLIIGALGFTFFFNTVESAFQIQQERTEGTLEMMFATPANRLALIYGRTFGSLISNVWLFSVFSIALILYNKHLLITDILVFPVVFVIFLFSATIWGGLINVIFMYSRDANIMFYILNNPMDFFSGTKMPVNLLPYWGQIVAGIFPLTYCLIIARSFFGIGVDNNIGIALIKLMVNIFIYFIITVVFLHITEKNIRKNGNAGLF